MRFISTSEHVARQLDTAADLEWSPAVIGLCKAFEAEIVQGIRIPLRTALSGEDLSADRADKDLSRVAVFCAATNAKPPELGAFSHLLHCYPQRAPERN